MERKLKHSKGALKQEKIDLITIDIAKKIIEGSENLDDSDCDDDVDSNTFSYSSEITVSK